MLDAIIINYKLKDFDLYIELIRKLHNIAINFEGDIRQYEKDFRKINMKIVNLNVSLIFSRSYLI